MRNLMFMSILGFACVAGVPAHAMEMMMAGSSPKSVIGQAAPDFTLETLMHERVNLTEYRKGGPAVIFFWATWCPHCRVQLKQLSAHKDELAQKGIAVVAVDLGEEKSAVKAYVERNAIGLDIFLDKGSDLSQKYGLIGVPTYILIDKNGIVQDIQHEMPDNFNSILK